MNTRVNAWRIPGGASVTVPLCLVLLALAMWVEHETLPQLVVRLIPFATPHAPGPCTGAPIPC